jgi:hypothetical protein
MLQRYCGVMQSWLVRNILIQNSRFFKYLPQYDDARAHYQLKGMIVKARLKVYSDPKACNGKTALKIHRLKNEPPGNLQETSRNLQ